MAESASGQDEANPTFWLVARAGKIVPSCPLGISRVDPSSKSYLFGHILSPFFTKLVRSRWLNIGLVLLFVFIDRDGKRTWPISSHLDLTLGQLHQRMTNATWKISAIIIISLWPETAEEQANAVKRELYVDRRNHVFKFLEKKKYVEWIIKQSLDSVSVWYEE